MLMVNSFLILRILLQHILNLKNSYKPSQNPPPIQFFSSPKWGGFYILKKNKPPKALPPICLLFLPPTPSFFFFFLSFPNSSFPSPPNSQTKPLLNPVLWIFNYFCEFCIYSISNILRTHVLIIPSHCGVSDYFSPKLLKKCFWQFQMFTV